VRATRPTAPVAADSHREDNVRPNYERPEDVSSDRLLLTPEEAAVVLRVGRTTVYGLIKEGQLRPVHIGRSCRLSRAELERYVSRLEAPPPPPPTRAPHRRPTTTSQGELFDLVHTQPEEA
jgi:excisionase family DNA binding protein